MPFPTTRWSLLVEATLHGGERQAAALAEFYRRYREPVVRTIRQQGAGPEQAEDLAQEFFLHLMQNSTLQRADPNRGRFRSFLLGALMRFLSRARTREGAAKRGDGRRPFSLDALPPGAPDPAVPAATVSAFDREWAHDLLARVRGELQEEWRGPPAELVVLMRYLPGAADTPAYAEAAAGLGWAEARLKTEVFRLRRKFRERVRAEVMLTVDEPHEVEAELAHLRRVLAEPPP